MDLNKIKYRLKETPAFVVDQPKIQKNLLTLAHIKKQSGCRVLYSVKALPLSVVMQQTVKYLDGLSVSSLYEARLAREVLGGNGGIHLTTPGLRDNEFNEISRLCSHVSFNSINQYQRLNNVANNACSLGLRVNPKCSFSNDSRFDPCREYSKLGIDIFKLDTLPKNIKGIHIHTVFSCTHYQPLIDTLSALKQTMGTQLSQLQWINLGGGYLYSDINHHQPFIEQVLLLKKQYGVDVYIEPGKAIVGNAGYLVTTVIDQFVSDGKQIVVLDTSVNHNPEVFEYQKKPELVEQDKQGAIACTLVGSSCLAGDIFGEYTLKIMPKIGDRMIFSNVGAYSLIKANRFNGYNLPDVYIIDLQLNISLIKQNTYQDYRQQWCN